MWIDNSGKLYKGNKGFEVGGVVYPKQAFRDTALMLSLGFKKYESIKNVDSRYYWEGQPVRTETETTVTDTISNGEPRIIDDRLEFEEDGVTPLLDSEGNQVITRGLKHYMKLKVKEQAGDEILTKYPEWKQRNLLAEYIELLNKKVDEGLTTEENDYMVALKAKYDDINAMRKASDDKEDEIDALSTIEEVIAYEQDVI